MKVYDWNESDKIALVEPGEYVPMETMPELTPVRECYLKQYHYVACVRGFECGLIITGRRPYFPDRWHGGIRPELVEGTNGENRRLD